MNTLELLAPAGSYEAVVAAVSNGADAVYMGYGNYNARRNAKNLSSAELIEAVEYCRLRGVKTYITLNTLLTDRELSDVAENVRELNRIGTDAVIVSDLGLIRLIRSVAPELPMHASTQMTVHNLEGVQFAAELGISRVVLARELNLEQIGYICKNSPIEIEVFVHGALCMSYSGQCYLSGIIGRRSGNRGLCAQPCRMAYHFNGRNAETYPLSLKDLCLAERISELRDMGVKSLKIEGRMKRPEYVAVVTNIYSKLIREERLPTRDEIRLLNDVFSRQGFTEGYYASKLGADMFGTRSEKEDPSLNSLYREARKSYQTETPMVNVRFYCLISRNEHAILAAEDTDGNRHIAHGDIAEPAQNKALSASTVREQLHKTGGTPFRCVSAKVKIDGDLALPLSAINAMRRECLDRLTAKRTVRKKRPEGEFNPGYKLINNKKPPVITVSVMNISQLSRELISRAPALIYVPLNVAAENPDAMRKISEKTTICVTLPRIIKDDERDFIAAMLDTVYSLGIRDAAVGNIGSIKFINSRGFTVHGDFGLNIFNSQTLKELKHAGVSSAVLSSELSFPQIRDLSKSIDTELIVYGRLPVMITENCIVQSAAGSCLCRNTNQITDRTGAVFPILREFEHRSCLLNSQKLFLADKRQDYENLGVWGARLMFTTENSKECVQVIDRYLGKNDFAPTVYTRGLYYCGVE